MTVDPPARRGRGVGNGEVLQHGEKQTLEPGFAHGAAQPRKKGRHPFPPRIPASGLYGLSNTEGKVTSLFPPPRDLAPAQA